MQGIQSRFGCALFVLAVLLGCGKSGGDGAPGTDPVTENDETAAAGPSTAADSSSSAPASSTPATPMSNDPPPADDTPLLTEAPDDWAPPADCKGVGNRCPNLSGCEEGSVCQAIGNVCVPDTNGGVSGSDAQHPYCAAFTCMSFEEASCFCTGPAGETEPRCASPSALGGLCGLEGSSCAMESCCDGFVCNDHGRGVLSCDAPCQTNEDCDTGCCTDRYDSGVLICAAQSACDNPCDRIGESCESGSATMPSSCCRGSCVLSDNSDFAGCRDYCTSDDECDTGCCEPFNNSTGGFCVDALYCSCSGAGAACGAQGLAACCEGLECADYQGGPQCFTSCVADTGCAAGEQCLLFANSTDGICVMPIAVDPAPDPDSNPDPAPETCLPAGSACGTPDLPFCCEDSVCQTPGIDQLGECRKICTSAADCDTGTCAPITPGSGLTVCSG